MWVNDWRQKLGALSMSGALLACGCFGQSGLPGSGVSSVAARPNGGFGPVGAGGATPTGAPGSPPGPVNFAGYNQVAEYQAADVSQKLAELQDENKSLAARLQGMQGLVEERERAVLSSRGEVQTATQEVTRARQEISRCRQEIASLREHTRAADKDSQASMQALVNVLETMLDRDNPQPNPAGKNKDVTKPAKEKQH
ncbi:MAG TPA: hypothetical protein VN688_13355 [Gemmataceae bacterium]|nr:hypothetical protein [Gemmataceae bacterium]